MKKTHSANIGGTVFTIEDDAYEKLQAYLQSIETHFHFYPDVKDIVADIEGRIAEQLLQREMAPHVVQMGDVERVIEAMGRIEQFDEPATEQAPRNETRRLFRDPDQKIIAGVAAGLAAYLGVPRLAVRLVFLLLVPFFGTAVVVYLLLWALAPTASSTTDKLQMRGRPVTLASIDQGVRDGIAGVPATAANAVSQSVTAVGSLIHLFVVTIVRLLKGVAGVFVVGAASLGVLFLTVTLVVALVNASAPPLNPDVAAFLANFGNWQAAFKMGVYLTAAIPLVMILATGLRLFWGANRLNTRGLAGMLAVWVVALLATAAISSSFYPQLQQFSDEYPVARDAQRSLERLSALIATASPLSAEQSKALKATLIAEHKRREAEHDRFFVTHPYDNRRSYLELEEQKLKAREESNGRIVDAAKGYLDGNQLTAMQGSLIQDNASAQASLDARREWMERYER